MKLPELHQALLDPETLDRLFSDLEGCTRILAVIPKLARHAQTGDVSVSLSQGRRGLLDGSYRGVQIRYFYEGREWCDTLLRLPGGGVRIVRLCSDDIHASLETPSPDTP